MLDAVIKRRSIRKYKEEEIPVHMVEEVLRAGLLAPSSKNRQPWKFIVVTGRSKAEMLEVFRQGLEREKKSPLAAGKRAVYRRGGIHPSGYEAGSGDYFYRQYIRPGVNRGLTLMRGFLNYAMRSPSGRRLKI